MRSAEKGTISRTVRERSGRYDTMTGAEVHDFWTRSAADRGGPTLLIL